MVVEENFGGEARRLELFDSVGYGSGGRGGEAGLNGPSGHHLRHCVGERKWEPLERERMEVERERDRESCCGKLKEEEAL